MDMQTSDAALDVLAVELGRVLAQAGLRLALAESCTGGWIAKVVTDVAGSSSWFDRGFVTYSNEAKMDLLGVPGEVLESHGAVSEQTVRHMAEGALRRAGVDVTVAVSGIAGPGGGSERKPVGTVCFAWARRGAETLTESSCFPGNRDLVRRRAVGHALHGLLNLLKDQGEQ
jgi:nicotinamide-nucleotide amidase